MRFDHAGGLQIGSVSVVGNNIASTASTGSESLIRINGVIGAAIGDNIFDVQGAGVTSLINATSSINVTVNNQRWNGSTPTTPFAGDTYTLMQGGPGVTFAQLPSIENGSQVWCSDCTLTGNAQVCSASGGTVGVVAYRIAGAWRCF